MQLIDGIPINPTLSAGFDCTPNEDRSRGELAEWWGKPFIVTYSWDDMKGKEEDEERRSQWFEHWPEGVRYDVRCLDGGAWDRSTWWGSAPNLAEAVHIAKSGPSWRGGQ